VFCRSGGARQQSRVKLVSKITHRLPNSVQLKILSKSNTDRTVTTEALLYLGTGRNAAVWRVPTNLNTADGSA